MTDSAIEDLEKRVAGLEKGMAAMVRSEPPAGEWKDWRLAVGKFTRTDISEEIDAAGRAIREADRREAQS